MPDAGHAEAVRSRLVVMLPGFEPVPLEAHCRRFVREAARTAPHYGVKFAFGEPQAGHDAFGTASFTLDTQGQGWESRAEVVFYDLTPLNDLYGREPWTTRLLRGFSGAFDILASGAPRRYWRDGWRFVLFFLAPFFLLASILLLFALAVLPIAAQASNAVWSLPLALFGAAALALLARRWDLLLMMDLWAITSDVARQRRPEIQLILETVAADVARRIGESSAEEIVVVGHSFGVLPAIMALADPRIRRVERERPVCLLALGSYLLAVAHHSAADALRATARHVLSRPIVWIDVQAQTDLINFYGANPRDALGLRDEDLDVGRPLTLFVRFRDQLSKQGYRQLRGDFFRTHRQFVYGVEHRSHYSLFAVIGGPERLGDIAPRGGLLDDWDGFASPDRAQS